MSKAEKAAENFINGLNCAQSVLFTYGPDSGLDREACIRIAAPFGGGMGHVQEVCGAVTGALMVIGLRHGEGTAERDRRDHVIELSREFIDAFRARFGSVLCRDLLACDISTREGLLKAREQGAFAVCADYVRAAGGLLDKKL